MTTFRAVQRLAQADSALAHVFGFHHLQLAGGARLDERHAARQTRIDSDIRFVTIDS